MITNAKFKTCIVESLGNIEYRMTCYVNGDVNVVINDSSYFFPINNYILSGNPSEVITAEVRQIKRRLKLDNAKS